uniref:Uncharacterized protein n=1 Tax=Solanum tuberosum TaxID=4113 RepID=M1DJZ8_SOLTU
MVNKRYNNVMLVAPINEQTEKPATRGRGQELEDLSPINSKAYESSLQRTKPRIKPTSE